MSTVQCPWSILAILHTVHPPDDFTQRVMDRITCMQSKTTAQRFRQAIENSVGVAP